jgi:hypothetical protein
LAFGRRLWIAASDEAPEQSVSIGRSVRIGVTSAGVTGGPLPSDGVLA